MDFIFTPLVLLLGSILADSDSTRTEPMADISHQEGDGPRFTILHHPGVGTTPSLHDVDPGSDYEPDEDVALDDEALAVLRRCLMRAIEVAESMGIPTLRVYLARLDESHFSRLVDGTENEPSIVLNLAIFQPLPPGQQSYALLRALLRCVGQAHYRRTPGMPMSEEEFWRDFLESGLPGEILAEHGRVARPPAAGVGASRRACLDDPWRQASADMQKLREKILTAGGEVVVMPPGGERDLPHLLLWGQAMTMTVVQGQGAPRRCHENTAAAYGLLRESGAQIGTGYVLDADDPGVWRQHSWVIHDGQILETTHPRQRYWGITLSGAAADRWAEVNRAPSTATQQ